MTTCSNLQHVDRLSSDRVLNANLEVLHKTHQVLAARLDSFPGTARIRVLPSRDGSVFYGYEEGGRIIPVTDPVAPIHRIRTQLDQYTTQLADTTRPILIVGLYPGNELLSIFDHSEKITTPHCPQSLLVCVDSLICLYGFLATWDVRRVLQSPRVRLFWHDDLQLEIGYLRQHPETPHLFTLISGAPDKTLDRILPSFAELIQKREEDTLRLRAENNEYYDGIDDQQLAEIIAGKTGRKPRLMMPTCSWSTFIQHSTRDTCAAFEDMRWETSILKMDAMLTPYYLVKSIHEFKPDVFLFIDHLRYEAEEVYPRNMMFMTWIQDEMNHIQCTEAGRKLSEYAARGKRDLVVGYVDQLDTKYGYPKDRLVSLHIPADPRIFHPIVLTKTDKAKYGCELSFITNVSMPSEQVVDEKIRPVVESLGISQRTIQAIHDHLWKEYRAEKTLTDRQEFIDWLMKYPEFKEAYEWLGKQNSEVRSQKSETQVTGFPLKANPRVADTSQASAYSLKPNSLTKDDLVRLFYWRLNDTIYRHVVLEWADELGLDVHLYGHGWENHPRFKKYAQGPIAHGSELNIAYQAAKLNLHLNITQGMHQRIWEIITAGARPLIRTPTLRASAQDNLPQAAMRRLARYILNGGTLADWNPPKAEPHSEQKRENEATSDWLFNIAFSIAQNDAKKSEAERPKEPLENRVAARIEAIILSHLEWIVEDWESAHFTDKAEFTAVIRDRSAQDSYFVVPSPPHRS